MTPLQGYLSACNTRKNVEEESSAGGKIANFTTSLSRVGAAGTEIARKKINLWGGGEEKKTFEGGGEGVKVGRTLLILMCTGKKN